MRFCLKIISLYGLLAAALPLHAGLPEWVIEPNQGWNTDTLTKMYFHNSEMQRQWAYELMGKQKLQGNEHILDFACGDGKISAELSRFVSEGKVSGFDLSGPMLSFARIKFPNYAYPNLEFNQTNSPTFDDFPGQHNYDLICAFCVFHFVDKPLEILKNLKTHLKPSGKLLLVIPTAINGAFFQAGNEIMDKYQLEAPWKKRVGSGALTMRTIEGSSFYLKEAGYEVLSIEKMETDTAYYDKEELVNWMIGTVTPNWNVPLSIAPQFFHDVVERMETLDPNFRDAEGRIHFESVRLYVVAQPA